MTFMSRSRHHYNYNPEVRKCLLSSFTATHTHKAVDQTVGCGVKLPPILMWAEPTWPPKLPKRDGLCLPSTFHISEACIKLAEAYFERSLQDVVFSFPTSPHRRRFTWCLRKTNSIIQHNFLPQVYSEFSYKLLGEGHTFSFPWALP